MDGRDARVGRGRELPDLHPLDAAGRPARSRSMQSMRDRAFARYFVADYACSVAWLSTANLMPVIVTAAAGATINAYWALAYAVALPLYSVSTSIGTSLLLHGTTTPRHCRAGAQGRDPGWLAADSGGGADRPAGAICCRCSARATPIEVRAVLRLLAIGALPNFLIVLSVNVARVKRRLSRAVIALGMEAAIALGLATPLLHAMGVTGVGMGWACAQCVVATGLLTWRSSSVSGRQHRTRFPVRPGTRSARLRPARSLTAPLALRPTRRSASGPGRSVCGPGTARLAVDTSAAAVEFQHRPVMSTCSWRLGLAALRDCGKWLGFVALPGGIPHRSGFHAVRPRFRPLACPRCLHELSSFRTPRSWPLQGAADHVLRHR